MRTLIDFAILFVVLIGVQVLIFNHIVLFNTAVPIVFIYFLIRLPESVNLNLQLTLAFLMGLTVDIFSDTPGVNAIGCTVTAMCRRPLLHAYVQKDVDTTGMVLTLRNLGPVVYMKYLLTVTAIYCLIVYSVEYFSFVSIWVILLKIAASALLSFLLLLSVDSIMVSRGEKRL